MRGVVAPAIGCVALAALLALLPPGEAPLSYDPEAWLVWGREMVTGSLDVRVGPAIKPAPMLIDAAAHRVAGSGGARAFWAVLALAAWAWLALAGARLARAQALDWWRATIVGLMVAGTGTLAAAGLSGGSEPLVALLLIGAAAARAGGRSHVTSALLAGAALMRPEALLLLLAHGVLGGAAHERRTRALAAGLWVMAVCAAWASIQLAGGAPLAGAAEAGGALRPGQPGLADLPVLASLGVAAEQLAPAALVLLIAIVVGGGVAPRPLAPLARACAAFGVLWIGTVASLAALGLSGEARYHAPGLALLVLAGAVALPRWASMRPSATLAVVAAAGVAVALPAGEAWHQARQLASSQADLTALLDQPQVREQARRCETVAVARFLRPAVALRLDRPMASVQSPSLRGADCRVVRRGAPGCAGRVVAEGGRWQWCRIDHPDSQGRN